MDQAVNISNDTRLVTLPKQAYEELEEMAKKGREGTIILKREVASWDWVTKGTKIDTFWLKNFDSIEAVGELRKELENIVSQNMELQAHIRKDVMYAVADLTRQESKIKEDNEVLETLRKDFAKEQNKIPKWIRKIFNSK